ncbi:MAG: protein kinase [Candidatus Eisenbacteria bacterium]|nr:protein kinase [Candidatus Eisenbacteria bacterium]
MPLSPGTRIGPYEVIAPLGAGGMGEVFRARDSRLGRDVAIKTLPDAFAAEPERLARFEREARLLASLSHPNIGGIHGLEDSGGHRHLVLELVEGETLGNRLARGPLPLDESLEFGRQIAAALDAAHEAGIVHRDLKPGNVMVTPAGDIKVLDFGLARGGGATPALDMGLSASPTMTYAATMAGVILGTAAYMSPEQARGRTVDRRSDIWSFGCVLFECLTGKILFSGETISDTIAKILEREPDWSLLPQKTPPRVRELLRRCLEKDARKRQRDAGDIKLEIDEILAGGVNASGTIPALTAAAAPASSQRGSLLAWGIAGLSLLVAAASWIAPRLASPPAPPPPVQSLIAPARGTSSDNILPADAAYSPDGTMIVFAAVDSAGRSQLWLRSLGSLDVRLITHTELVDGGLPFWSPDSRRIGFFSDRKLRIIGLDGGSSQIICDAPSGRGGTWNGDGVILFAPTSSGPLQRVSVSGGKPEAVLPLDEKAGETAQRFPRFLPDGKQFTFASLPARNEEITTFIGRLGATERRVFVRASSSAAFVPPNLAVFTRGQTLMAQRCDPSSLTLKGEPVAIGDAPSNLWTWGTNPASCSDRGDIVFPTSVSDLTYLEWMSPSGQSLSRPRIPEAQWAQISLSPDGRQAAILRSSDSRETNIWLVDPIRGTAAPITTEGGPVDKLIWSPDGREIFYTADRTGRQNLYARRTTGSYEERLVFQNDNMFKLAQDISPDGRFFLFAQLDPVTRRDLWVVPSAGGNATPFLTAPAEQNAAIFSPDGHWVAYQSDESGRLEIYVTSFPIPETKIQVSTAGGGGFFWLRQSWEIRYLSPAGRLMSCAVRPGPTLQILEPREVGDFSRNVRDLDITADGQRILAIRGETAAGGSSLTLLTNWHSLLDKH